MIPPINSPKFRNHYLIEALSWIDAGHRLAMITLINIEGNAPYPIGSQMLVRDDGYFLGQITGGCAERAIADHALESIRQGKNTCQRYGLNSPYFDIRLPCGSGIDVYIDVNPSSEEYRSLTKSLKNRMECSQTIDSNLGQFVKSYFPTERMLLLGQGPILLTLAQMALISGFELICVGQHEEAVQQLANIGVQAVDLSSFNADPDGCTDAYTSVVSLFHEHDHEARILYSALHSPAFYIGALGSRRTHSQRLATIKQLGVDSQQLDRIHGPVGLDIGARTPSQIAVSILAEVIEHLPKPEQNLLLVDMDRTSESTS